MVNIGEDQINPEIRILLLPSADGLLGKQLWIEFNSLSLGWETALEGI
jgi:hypothetical protein